MNNAFVMLQSGSIQGTIKIEMVEVFRMPNLCSISQPTRTATDAKTDVFAGFTTDDGSIVYNYIKLQRSHEQDYHS